jgi:hypothetical protein
MRIGRLACMVVVATSCSFPGIRPEGRIVSVTGSAPAAPGAVFSRARTWYERNGYAIQNESEQRSISGVRVLEQDGSVVTRARVDFVIRDGTTTETRYTTTSRVERGVPPNFEAIDYTGSQATATTSLDGWLSCGSARWPACP